MSISGGGKSAASARSHSLVREMRPPGPLWVFRLLTAGFPACTGRNWVGEDGVRRVGVVLLSPEAMFRIVDS